MSFVPFDTHEYFEELKKGGFSDEQAKAQTRAQSKALSLLVINNLVTKDDLKREVSRLEQDINNLANETKTNIHNMLFKIGSMIALATTVMTTILTLVITFSH